MLTERCCTGLYQANVQIIKIIGLGQQVEYVEYYCPKNIGQGLYCHGYPKIWM